MLESPRISASQPLIMGIHTTTRCDARTRREIQYGFQCDVSVPAPASLPGALRAKSHHYTFPLEYNLRLARQYLHNENRNYHHSRYCFLQSVYHGNDGARGYRNFTDL